MSGDADRCRVCDGPVAVTDRFCVHCGHDLSAGLVPLVGARVDEAAGKAPSERTGRSPVTALVVAGLGALVAVVVGVVWATGGDDGPADRAPVADGPDGAVGPDPGGEPSDGAGSDDGPVAPNRRTEIRPGPTPVPPMLDVESDLLTVIRTDEALLVVDLDTGDQTRVEISTPAPEEAAGSLTALVGDEIWVLDGSGLRAFLADGLREVDPARAGFDATGVVALHGGRSPAEPTITVSAEGESLLHRPGREPVPFILPPGFEILGAHDGDVVLTRPEIGGVWVLGGGRITTGRPLALAAGKVVVLDCGEDLTCSFEVLDLATGESVRSVPAEAEPRLPDGSTTSVLSPDATLHVLAGGGSTTEQVLDLTTGERIPGLVTGVVTAVAFSPDSRWLFLGGDAADRALLTAVPRDLSLPQRAIATNVGLGAAREVLILARGVS